MDEKKDLSLIIIPDGSRRKHGYEVGHKMGAEFARTAIEIAFEEGFTHVVFWVASALNLKERPQNELLHLRRLFKEYLQEIIDDTEHEGKVSVCGDYREYCQDEELDELIRQVERRKANGSARHLTLLFGHDGLVDVAKTSQSLADRNVPITSASIKEYLPTAHVGEVDYIFRSGVEGDPHNSGNLMIAQTGNAQYIFEETLWSDLNAELFRQKIAKALLRERRLGK